MNKTVFSAVLLAAFAYAGIGSAEDQSPSEPRYIGQITGDPEKDTFGYAVRNHDAQRTAAPVLSEAPQYVGSRTGDGEKDTFGHVVLRSQAAGSIAEK